ncbi:TetR/AcrR family transcriptional regulator [Actinocorallia sp. API 0066]|uniref:TetR/AcrR family transcriptional regulator n=1 Tax=Actinocorallia sp. API 0066 TaxID=2896846 RepID=UPI001E588D7F|nr:TetR/AcrR family transcriptional regulator [Actinocorallia sp. API 0066]MCD0447877.1 TetR/AcrR family transcriptional regulator [Actinocorallia sp. API 0066]
MARVQRARLCRALAEAMAERGYAATSVEHVLKRAGVSRLSFYQLFDSKADCFVAAFEQARDTLLERVLAAFEEVAGGDDPVECFERVISVYLEVLVAEWPLTRLVLVEVYAAGPGILGRGREAETAMAGAYAQVFGLTDARGMLTCRMLVAATNALATSAVAANDPDGLLALRPQLVEHVRALWECGALSART